MCLNTTGDKKSQLKSRLVRGWSQREAATRQAWELLLCLKTGHSPLSPPTHPSPSPWRSDPGMAWEQQPGDWGVAVWGWMRRWWKKQRQLWKWGWRQELEFSAGTGLWLNPATKPGLAYFESCEDQDRSLLSLQHLVPSFQASSFKERWNGLDIKLQRLKQCLLTGWLTFPEHWFLHVSTCSESLFSALL